MTCYRERLQKQLRALELSLREMAAAARRGNAHSQQSRQTFLPWRRRAETPML